MNMSVKNIIDDLQDAGLTITLLPHDRLSVSPAKLITDTLRALIRDNKAAIIHSLEEANNENIVTGTRRPKDLSPKLLAASKALDRQLTELGYDIGLPWMALSDAYSAHYIKCPQCQTTGYGYGQRCGVGVALWVRTQQVSGR